MSSFGEQEQSNECPSDSGPTGWPVGGEKEQPSVWGQSSPLSPSVHLLTYDSPRVDKVLGPQYPAG